MTPQSEREANISVLREGREIEIQSPPGPQGKQSKCHGVEDGEVPTMQGRAPRPALRLRTLPGDTQMAAWCGNVRNRTRHPTHVSILIQFFFLVPKFQNLVGAGEAGAGSGQDHGCSCLRVPPHVRGAFCFPALHSVGNGFPPRGPIRSQYLDHNGAARAQVPLEKRPKCSGAKVDV